MFVSKRIRELVVLTIMLALGLSSSAFAAQDKDKKKKNEQLMAEGTPVLWRDPGDISARNLLAGPGGEEMKPDLTSVTFIKEETGGYSPKFRVRDGAGKVWVAKLGSESQPETAASRLVWAVGYPTEIHYLYPCVQIQGAPKPKKEVKRCEGNGFANVRFEARPENVKRLDKWSWTNNPFKGTKEFQGLIVMMALVNNWDLKDDNNKVLFVPGGEGGQAELYYIISDLGATFGKTGNFITRSRNKPKDYVKTKLIDRVEGNQVRIDYSGKMGELFSNITVEQAAWIGSLLSQLSDEQIGDAFRAANYSPEEVQALTGEVREKINELAGLSKSSALGYDP